ncbi:glycerophosphodiester phosphodiesterase [Kitasatospora aureofaciens]|uniref:glycerophosphodiester phosphodiesterase n=1 Tax=Kitasatospora aureofaciens TaxID=1894 RepID=UPI001C43853D|nr:glycerophosphodiester phosphodiesterase [Kitasatospora aureofaciens]MBV6701065.1 glycerophosphodiester phosphodiesterase [Kitasatospora aureofaciens]
MTPAGRTTPADRTPAGRTTPADRRPVLAVAHRGDPYRHRENTLPSVESALARGADAVEVDVQLTRDKVPVLLHDTTLERLWGDPRAIGRVTVAQLDELHEGALAVPTLAEAIKTVAAADGPRLLIDLDEPGPAAATWSVVTGLGAERLVAFCGPATAMLAVRALTPDAEIALTWKQPRLPVRALLDDLRPRYINPPFGLVTPEFTAAARDAGLAVSTWTADLRRTMRRLRDAGVDSITTNRIDVLRSVLDGRR